MPHRGKRTSVRREWLLSAIRIIDEHIQRDERPIAITVLTLNDAGTLISYTLPAGDETVQRTSVMDPIGLIAATDGAFIPLKSGQ